MSLEIDFFQILVDFGSQNGTKLAPKSDQKSISTSKSDFQLNTSGLDFSWLSGLQVGNKNRIKIGQKMESKMDCIMTSIFDRFLIDFGGHFWRFFGSKT